MLFTGELVFSLSWAGPETKKKKISDFIEKMLNSLIIGEGFTARRRKEILKKEIEQMRAVSMIKET